ADGDAGAGAADEGGGGGRQHPAAADRGREGAGGGTPAEHGGVGQLVGHDDVGGRAHAGVGDGDGEGSRVAGVDRGRETGGERRDDRELRQRVHKGGAAQIGVWRGQGQGGGQDLGVQRVARRRDRLLDRVGAQGQASEAGAGEELVGIEQELARGRVGV